MSLPASIPYQKEILEHQKNNPNHKGFSIRGIKKKEKIHGAFCKTCKKFISEIKVVK